MSKRNSLGSSPGAAAWAGWASSCGGRAGDGAGDHAREGATWLTGTFDPELNTLFWPVGNPGPDINGDVRKGDNLFSDSVVALDADTGKLVWQKKLDNQAFTRITGTVKLHDGHLYVPIASQEENAGANPQYSCCTFRGNLVVVKASDGSVVWRTYTAPEAKPTRKSAARECLR